jgi:hypothetical protein
MSATPLFLITDAGLAAASVAMPEGPYIHITSFEIGDGYGYDPQTTDTGLNGNLLYTGAPTSYSNIGNNTINIVCQIPPDAGPFEFGEVALFLEGGVMFAKAVFDTLQYKYSSLGTNVVSSYTLNCLLKLQQSTAVFQIDTTDGPPAVWEVFQWSDIFPPGISANPDIPLTLCRELNTNGDSSLLQNTSDENWSLNTSYWPYSPIGTSSVDFAVANSSTSWVEVLATSCHPQDLTAANRQFVVQTSDGFFRSVSSVAVSGANYRFSLNVSSDGTYVNTPLLNAPTVGSNLRIYRDDQAGGSIYYSQIIDPPNGGLQANNSIYEPVTPEVVTLTAADLGGSFTFSPYAASGSGLVQVIELPPYANLVPGNAVQVSCFGSDAGNGILYVNANGGGIDISNGTFVQVPMFGGETTLYVYNGDGTWLAKGSSALRYNICGNESLNKYLLGISSSAVAAQNTANAVNSAFSTFEGQFQSSVGTNPAWRYLPTSQGVTDIEQWGVTAVSGWSGFFNVSFALGFPNAVTHVDVVPRSNNSSHPDVCANVISGSIGNGGFQCCIIGNTSSDTFDGFYWSARGY